MNKSASLQHYEEDQVKWTNSNNGPSCDYLCTWTRLHDATNQAPSGDFFSPEQGSKTPHNWCGLAFTLTSLLETIGILLKQGCIKLINLRLNNFLWNLINSTSCDNSAWSGSKYFTSRIVNQLRCKQDSTKCAILTSTWLKFRSSKVLWEWTMFYPGMIMKIYYLFIITREKS